MLPIQIDTNRPRPDGDVAPVELSVDRILAALDDVKDPEIPVVSVVELGIVQAVEIDGQTVRVVITPTFSGCPALELMRAEIGARVRALGAAQVEVPVRLDPPWSSDRIAPQARERMKKIGLAPPPPATGGYQPDADLLVLTPASRDAASVDETEALTCPFCGASDTRLENAFGPTICRSLHYCQACQQPFEQFKAL